VPLVCGLLPGDEATRLEHLIVGYGLAGLPFAVVLATWRRLNLRSLWVVAVGIRLLLLLLPPLLSEDVWRYVWDGAVQLAGLDPYRHAPADPALDALALDPILAAVRAQIGHADIATIYPPGAQIIFMITGLAGPNPIWIRLLLVAADGLTLLGLARWAQALGRPPQLAALYAFAPPAVLEGAVGGHIDGLGVALLVGAGLAFSRRRDGWAGAALGASIATKLLPVLVVPLLLRRAWRVVAVAAVVAGLLALPYLGGSGPGEGLAQYGGRWRGNDGAFALLINVFEHVWPPGSGTVDLSPTLSRLVLRLVAAPADALPWAEGVVFAAAKLAALGLFSLVWLALAFRHRRAPPIVAFAGLLGPAVAALLLLSPVVHPWYLLWLLPFLALAAPDARWPWPLLGWNCLIFLAYLPRPAYLRTGVWLTGPELPLLEYLPVWFGLALVGMSRVQRRGHRATDG